MKNSQPVDAVILILTGVVGIALIIAFVAPLITGNSVNEHNAKIIERLMTALITIISIYVGSKVKRE